MKILQIGPYPPPMGGWSFHVKVFKEYLHEHSCENRVLNIGESRRQKSGEYIDVQNAFDYVLKNLKYNVLGYKIYNHLDGVPLKGFLLTLASQFIALIFCRRTTVSFHAGLNQRCFKKDQRFFRFLAKTVFFLADKIICNSVEVKNMITTFGIDEEKIYPVPCFSRQYLEYEHTINEEQEAFINGHSPVLFTYVFFRPEFTIDILINSINRLLSDYPGLGLVIAGSRNGSEEVLDMIHKLGMSANVFFAGDLSHDNFLTLLGRADIYVRTHLNDGVCSSVLESVALGTPVIASANEMRPEGIITFQGADGNDLYEKLRYALGNLPEARSALEGVALPDNLKKEMSVLLAS